jgi:oligosaccharide repeat unit polymerase
MDLADDCPVNVANPWTSSAVVRWGLAALCLAILFAAALRGGDGATLAAFEVLAGLAAFLLLCRAAAKAINWADRIDIFAPVVAFPLGYLLWFVIGSVDFIQVPSSVSFGLFDPIPIYLWFYIAAGLAAYFLGVGLCRMGQTARGLAARRQNFWNRQRFGQIIAALFVLMFASYAYITAQIGIPALSPFAGEIRLELVNFGPSQAVLFSSAWTIILFLLIFVWGHEHSKAMGWACWIGILCAVLLLLSLGSRGQLFVPVVTAIVVRHYIKAPIKLRKLVAIFVIVFCFIGIFGYIRDTALNGGNEAEEWLNLPAPLVPFVYAYLYIRYPVATFRDLTAVIPKNVGYQFGALSLGPLDTLLPGHHEQSDIFFKKALGNDFVGAGQPATLLAPLYADGGAIGVVIGMFLFGMLMAASYRRMVAEPTVFRALIYAWVVQTGIFSFYSNLFPYITTLWMPLMWLFLNRMMRAQALGSPTSQAAAPTALGFDNATT